MIIATKWHITCLDQMPETRVSLCKSFHSCSESLYFGLDFICKQIFRQNGGSERLRAVGSLLRSLWLLASDHSTLSLQYTVLSSQY